MIELTDAYCGIEEAAETLRVHPESVRRIIRNGRLRASKLGGKWFVNRVYLQQYARSYNPRPGNNRLRSVPTISGKCPGCGHGDTRRRPLIVKDRNDRRWHLYCAEKALACMGVDDGS